MGPEPVSLFDLAVSRFYSVPPFDGKSINLKLTKLMHKFKLRTEPFPGIFHVLHPCPLDFYPQDRVWIIRNLTTFEYIRAEQPAFKPICGRGDWWALESGGGLSGLWERRWCDERASLYDIIWKSQCFTINHHATHTLSHLHLSPLNYSSSTITVKSQVADPPASNRPPTSIQIYTYHKTYPKKLGRDWLTWRSVH